MVSVSCFSIPSLQIESSSEMSLSKQFSILPGGNRHFSRPRVSARICPFPSFPGLAGVVLFHTDLYLWASTTPFPFTAPAFTPHIHSGAYPISTTSFALCIWFWSFCLECASSAWLDWLQIGIQLCAQMLPFLRQVRVQIFSQILFPSNHFVIQNKLLVCF